MPKLPIIKDKDLIRALKSLDFFEKRQTGSHLIMKHNDGRRITAPLHPGKDIPRGTLKAILRDAEISVNELIKVLKN